MLSILKLSRITVNRMPCFRILYLFCKTTQLWIQRDMAKATTVFMLSIFFYLFVLAIALNDFAYAFVSVIINVGAYYLGMLVILYEHVFVTQERFILDSFITKSKVVKAFRNSLVDKTLGIRSGITGTSRWALAAKGSVGQK